jgi:hypothetical protein
MALLKLVPDLDIVNILAEVGHCFGVHEHRDFTARATMSRKRRQQDSGPRPGLYRRL